MIRNGDFTLVGDYTKVKNYRGLLEFIISQYPELSHRKIASKLPISWGTYSAIRNGLEPDSNVQRKLKGWLAENFSLTVNENEQGKIQLIEIENFNVKGNLDHIQSSDYSGGGYSQRIDFLLDELQKQKTYSNKLELKIKELEKELDERKVIVRRPKKE